jgi:hypothetical protein
MKRIHRYTIASCLFAVAATPQLASAHGKGKDRRDPPRVCGESTRGNHLEVVGLTSDQRLVCFNEKKPGKARDIGFVSGLSGDTALIGIDYRVQDGGLYGVGNAGGVYKIDAGSGAATLVNQLSVALSGASFGVDFNPAADRLRIVSDTGQNLRHNVNAGGVTLSDLTLTYTAPPATPVAALGVTGSAYTNNDVQVAPGTTATTLFNIDTTLDQVVIQSPPNNGVLAATGKLGVDAGSVAGFDIYSTLEDGVTVDNEALAVLNTAAGNVLYAVNLTTGEASARGSFAAHDVVVDIAIPLAQD